MIKKTTRAIFQNGAYAGEYDWEGGIPLSKGEAITVALTDGAEIVYVVSNKETVLSDDGQDQHVSITYFFDIVS